MPHEPDRALQWVHPVTKSRGLRAPRVLWTEPELELLSEIFPHMHSQDVAALLGCTVWRINNASHRLGLRKTNEYMAADIEKRRALAKTNPNMIANRFHKGQVPPNKGVRGISYPGMEKTQFRKGDKPKNWKPVGSVRVNSDGYADIKLAEGMFQWKQLHREVWKEAHGSYPPKGWVLAFKDRQPLNCRLDNLVLLTLKENMLRNSLHNNYPPELIEVVQLQAALNHRINNRLKKAHPEDPNYVKKHRRSTKYLVRDAKRAERQNQSHGS
ncbi:HNH endonuclease signature motif containing protein [Rhodoferax sp.]|uniref:HNH endonuclease signature motif containing protein n=1 Tax=Rhodoferax sp. TaxID=50421 RepID=UPI00275A28AC|nr:HNH endonuclease signature motif containing protein [Rhodoferax sp.]